jgi:sugar lactone lactonase YvrE
MKKENVILTIVYILILVPLIFINAQSQEAMKAFARRQRKPVKLVRMFGKGQFGSINNICVSPKGIIYISDAGALSIKAFNMRGEFLFSFGGKEPQASEPELQSIMELSSDKDGNVYVADYNQNLVNVYDYNGKYLFNIRLNAELQKKFKDRGVSGVAVNSRGDIYITDSANGRIEVRDNNGKYKFQIDKFKDKDGKELELISPTHPRINSNDELYVIDPIICRVHHFDVQGNYLGTFGRFTEEAMSGLAIDKYDRVYVIDMNYNSVQVFDREGKFLYALCDEDAVELYIPYPTGFAVDNNGYFYIGCNDGGWGVMVFKYSTAWEDEK